MTSTIHEAGRRIALEEIRVPENVRALDDAHVQALAGSIALQGMLVPVVVRDDGDGFELVAGFHRIAAARSLGLADVPVVAREAETEDADRPVANIMRKQLNACEEVIHLGAVDQLRAIGTVAPELLDAVIAYLDDGNAWAAERLTREPGWVLDAALTHAGNSKVFAAYLHGTSAHEIAELRLGKKTEQLYSEAEKLHRQLDRYAYGPPQVRFTDADVDQARAAGVLIEFERGRPLIVDRALYRELVKGAIKRIHDDLEAKAATAAKEKKTARVSKPLADPVTVAKRDRDAQLRELTDQAFSSLLKISANTTASDRPREGAERRDQFSNVGQ